MKPEHIAYPLIATGIMVSGALMLAATIATGGLLWMLGQAVQSAVMEKLGNEAKDKGREI